MSEGQKTRKHRWVNFALALSLALNVAVVGLVAGAVLGRDGGSGGRGQGGVALRALGLGPFAMALTREHRQELRGRIESSGLELRQERRAIGRALRDVETALRADPFDRTRAEAALMQSRTLVVSLQEAGHGALLDQIEAMNLSEREELADALTRALRRNGPRR